MTTLSSPRYFVFLGLLLLSGLLNGCSHNKTNRGHLFRCDWAFEYNRTPWVGCPPDSGCDSEGGCNNEGCTDCAGKHKNCFRRHCGLTPDCTAKHPCSKTLGCGMWIDPSDPNSFAALNPQNQGIKACGLTPFCSPMKPCGLTPWCGRAVNQQYMNQQALMLGNNAMPHGNISSGTTSGHPLLPTLMPGKTGNERQQPGTQPAQPGANVPGAAPVIARPNTPLVTMGVVPGISRVITGGTVAVSGVMTPFGKMTPNGVQLPNGTVNPNVVLRACCSNGNCLPSRPCGQVPGCGGLVAVAQVQPTPLNNVMLASAYQQSGVAGQVMQAGGRVVNPITGQPVYGLSMSGYPQTGYPPIGYAPTGYSPGYPQQQGTAQGVSPAVLAQLVQSGQLPASVLQGQLEQTTEEEEPADEEQEESVLPAGQKSKMPVPRFHPVPTKPAFQREPAGAVPGSFNPGETKKTAALSRRFFTDEKEDGDVSTGGLPRGSENDTEWAYLAGMSAAMDQVEEELNGRERELQKKHKQEELVKRAEELQAKIDRQRKQKEQLEREKAEREERLQAQQEEQQAVEEQERAVWEEAVQQQLAEAKLREEKLRKQLARQHEQLQAQVPMSVQPAYSNNVPAQRVQPVNFAMPRQDAPRAVPIPAAVPSNSPLFTPVREAGGLFESALNYLKGNETIQPRQRTAPQRQQIPQAKSAGTGFLPALNGVVSPLSGLLGADKPLPQQTRQTLNPETVQRTPQTVQPPMPVQPPTIQSTKRTVSASAAVPVNVREEEPPKPTRPPTAPKKVRKAVADADDDAPVIRQAAFFE
ncbi:MAG: hypothetical protein LBN39_12870 [Planctomycetaceae bacterium]|jgi:hypothetical protein|nr:hypothetical protein [Planctomycetaceae bacterium]